MNNSDDWEVIDTYTRAEAIADGVLVDVSKLASEAGYRYPVALTREVYYECVKVPEAVASHQSEEGRTWDILTCMRLATPIHPDRPDVALFTVGVANKPAPPVDVRLKVVCSPGDTSDAVLTVMFPHQD